MATEMPAEARRAWGCILVIIGLFFGGLGAAGLVDEWDYQRNWSGAVIAPCVVTEKGESPILTCEVRSKSQPPIQRVLRSEKSLWRWASIGQTIEIEYLPQDPERTRYLPPAGRSGRTTTHHLRGLSRLVVCGILVAIGAVPLFHGVGSIRQASGKRNRS
jgi:hypothetical protein